MAKEQYQEIHGVYRRREPEKTILYQVVQQNLETFLAQMREACPDHDPIPDYVEQTFRNYLDCGILAHGFGRCWCPTCRQGFAVAFSCKSRGLCPSCNSKRMAQTGAHIIDHVMPRVPVRQVVLSVPKRLRWYLHRDPKVVSGVMRVFLRALSTTIRKHSPDAPRDAKMGAVSFFHRGGSSLNVHPHFHNVVADGVFALDADGQAVFFPASELCDDVFAGLQETLRKRILRYFSRHGYLDDDVVDDMLCLEHGGGFSLHGGVRIDDSDREGQEKLLRYCARPPFAQDRLGWWNEERQQLVYQFQRPLPGGQTYEVLSAMDLMKRLAELIPPPWMHLVRYYGVLAPHAKMREQVVMLAGPSEALRLRLQKAAEKMGLELEQDSHDSDSSDEDKEEKTKVKKRASVSWALLMARIFEFLPLLCPRCDSPMKMVGFIMEPKSVNQVLDHLDLPTEAPPVHPPRAPPQLELNYVDEF
jgi:hypothetical protein